MISVGNLFEITLNFCRAWRCLSQLSMSDSSGHSLEWSSMFRGAISRWQTINLQSLGKKTKLSLEVYKLVRTGLWSDILIKREFLHSCSRCKREAVEMYQEAWDRLKDTFSHKYERKRHHNMNRSILHFWHVSLQRWSFQMNWESLPQETASARHDVVCIKSYHQTL